MIDYRSSHESKQKQKTKNKKRRTHCTKIVVRSLRFVTLPRTPYKTLKKCIKENKIYFIITHTFFEIYFAPINI